MSKSNRYWLNKLHDDAFIFDDAYFLFFKHPDAVWLNYCKLYPDDETGEKLVSSFDRQIKLLNDLHMNLHMPENVRIILINFKLITPVGLDDNLYRSNRVLFKNNNIPAYDNVIHDITCSDNSFTKFEATNHKLNINKAYKFKPKRAISIQFDKLRREHYYGKNNLLIQMIPNWIFYLFLIIFRLLATPFACFITGASAWKIGKIINKLFIAQTVKSGTAAFTQNVFNMIIIAAIWFVILALLYFFELIPGITVDYGLQGAYGLGFPPLFNVIGYIMIAAGSILMTCFNNITAFTINWHIAGLATLSGTANWAIILYIIGFIFVVIYNLCNLL